jgi:hypothetical protein
MYPPPTDLAHGQKGIEEGRGVKGKNLQTPQEGRSDDPVDRSLPRAEVPQHHCRLPRLFFFLRAQVVQHHRCFASRVFTWMQHQRANVQHRSVYL